VTESAASGVTQTVALTVDGHPVTVPEGSSILAAAREVGVTIPTLCYHDTLHVASACRLCIVEVEGRKDPLTACDTPAVDGMVVTTQSPELRAIRQLNLELIKLEHELFRSGLFKVFLLFFDSCGVCLECAAERTACKEPTLARPTPEGLGVDVYTTVRKIGYPIEVLPDYDREMNRYAFLLID